MKLNHNSISAKLYRWFYDMETMPSNICPYFWKLVFMWVMILPYVLITLPAQILTLFEKKSFGETCGYMFAFFVVGFVLTLLAVFPVAYFFNLTFEEHSFWKPMFFYSMSCWLIIAIFGLYFGVKYLVTKIKDSKKLYDEDGDRYYGYDANGNKIYYQEEKPNIIVEFIKAKYNKYCAKIDWQK